MESTTYPALIQLEQKDAGFERFAQDGLFLSCVGRDWDDLVQLIESQLNKVLRRVPSANFQVEHISRQ